MAAQRPQLAFQHALRFGIIRARPNRFKMVVDVDGEQIEAHCPATGRIGNLTFTDIPCLVSDSHSPPLPALGKPNASRKTRFTVEAISLSPLESFGTGAPSPDESWIGINQGRTNRFVEHFLRAGNLPDLIPSSTPGAETTIKREQTVGGSKIDLVAQSSTGTAYIEVKTPLIHLPTAGHPRASPDTKKLDSYHRLVKHFGDLGNALPAPGRGGRKKRTADRSVLLLTFQYDAPQFRRPPATAVIKAISDAADAAVKRGVEFYQLNLKLRRDGVELIRCWKLPDDY
ncbi:hypothetical protein DFJ74DRAFT_661808 [Hyaloraphidium curvatum]|nr:hypothetical protein DFJ74DRAFT_661808 [Hyaloraphidium curvatum]